MKLLKLLLIMIVLLFSGCVTMKPAFHSKIPSGVVYIDPFNTWVNQCPVVEFGSHCVSPWRTITLRVINKKYREVDVTIECFDQSGIQFGQQTKSVAARDDVFFRIWGLARSGVDADKVSCRITKVR